MFVKDGHHQSIAFLLRDGRPVKLVEAAAENQFEKFLIMRELGNEVRLTGADALFTINEVWMAPVEELGPYERAGEAVNRKEALVLTLISREKNPIQLCAMIQRRDDSVVLDDTEFGEPSAAFAFAPIYEAWGKAMPDEWMQAVERYEAAIRKNPTR
jgi:hypothetical protein